MNAIVLSRRDFREGDQIITCLTEEYGKRDFIARGIKKCTSKNGAALEPFSFVFIGVAEGKDRQYITSVQLQEYFSEIRADVQKSMYAGYMVSLVESWVLPHEQNTGIYAFLLRFLSVLATHLPSTDFLDTSILELLSYIGFELVLDACIVCEKQALGATTYTIDIAAGGVVCRGCQTSGREYVFLRGDDMLSLRQMMDPGDKYTCISTERVHSIILAFAEFHMEKQISDWAYIEKVLK